ncbi:MAG: globin [Gammaproteobacteria bacterium]|jgi:hemoglobin-like flavoprotein|nr:globin [Gammaproteobacteria bacterium]MBT6059053.1 globin [Gammaproteobacteria bacterium]MBT6245837.1 globin [Gammaproteobacteria bacterium]
MNLELLFEESFQRIIGHGVGITKKGQHFFTRFYEIFFEASDEVREKFRHTDMEMQRSFLKKGVYHLISFYLLRSDYGYLSSIAKTHNQNHYNIRPELYDIWLESLLKAVAELDPKYCDELRLAWQIVMTPGILFLKYHYAEPELKQV